MNVTKAKRRLKKRTEKENRLEYEETGADPIDDDNKSYIYGYRRRSNNEFRWSVRQLSSTPIEIGDSVEHEAGRQQLVLHADVEENSNEYRKYELTNIEYHDRSPIEKPKDEIKKMAVQLWHMGRPEHYISEGTVITPSSQVCNTSEMRPIREDDFKVTTKWGQKGSAHLGHVGLGGDYLFKLGINWRSWHRSSPTQNLKTLTHELIHCKHMHHQDLFYKEHAKFVKRLAKDEHTRSRVESVMGETINWDELKAITLNGVHSQPMEIDTQGYQNRRSACNALIKDLEDILDYPYKAGRILYINPPTKDIYPAWVFDGYEEPENKTSVQIEEVEVNEEFTDIELLDFYESIQLDIDGHEKTAYTQDDIPIVEDGKVIENAELVCFYRRIKNRSKSFRNPQVEVPVRQKSSEQEENNMESIPQ